mgnify:CR=1 FL=1
MNKVIILLLFVLASLFKSEAQTIDMQEKLNQSLSDLSQIRKSIADEKLPMVKELNLIEDDLLDVRLEYQEAIRKLDNRSLDLNNLFLSSGLSKYNPSADSKGLSLPSCQDFL